MKDLRDTTGTTTETKINTSIEDIIMEKLNSGIIEKAIDEQFDIMVETSIENVFSSYGGVGSSIEKKLKETMNPYIEKYDFSAHNVKIEHLLNNIMANANKNQSDIINKVNYMMGTIPVSEIKLSAIFKEYGEYVIDNIETYDREIDFDSGHPRYIPVHIDMLYVETDSSDSCETATLEFRCIDENDELDLDIDVVIFRWLDCEILGDDWKIRSIYKKSGTSSNRSRYSSYSKQDTLDMETPLNNLKQLNSFETFLLKLHYDDAIIDVDETDLTDEDLELLDEPECGYE